MCLKIFEAPPSQHLHLPPYHIKWTFAKADKKYTRKYGNRNKEKKKPSPLETLLSRAILGNLQEIKKNLCFFHHEEEAEIAPIILQSSQPITIIGRDTEVHGE